MLDLYHPVLRASILISVSTPFLLGYRSFFGSWVHLAVVELTVKVLPVINLSSFVKTFTRLANTSLLSKYY